MRGPGTTECTGKSIRNLVIGAGRLGTGSVILDGRRLDIDKSAGVEWVSGQITLKNRALVNNDGSFSATPAVSGTIAGEGARPGQFINNKVFRVGAIGRSVVSLYVPFDNNWTVEIDKESWLQVSGGGKSIGGWLLSSDAYLQFGSLFSPATYTWDGRTLFDFYKGDQALEIPPAERTHVLALGNFIIPNRGQAFSLVNDFTLAGTINNEGTFLIAPSRVFNWLSGSITGPGQLNMQGTANLLQVPLPTSFVSSLLSGPLGIVPYLLGLPGTPLVFSDGFFSVFNRGTVNLYASAFRLDKGALLTIGPGRTFDIKVDGIIIQDRRPGDAQSRIVNNGLFMKTGGAGVSEVKVIKFDPAKGTVLVKSGTLKIPGITPVQGKVGMDPSVFEVDGPLVLAGGALYGSGTAIADVYNAGEVDPGGVALPGVLNITGNYSQSTSSGTGILNIDIGGSTAGSGFDQLNITGSATLAGSLNLQLIGGFAPSLGTSFKIMTFASRVGDFGAVTGLLLGSNRFDVQYNPTNVTLVVVAAVPAPAPAVTGLTPSSGTTAGATAVSATGTNFTGAYDVSFGAVPARSFVVNSDTSITAVSPAQAAGTVDVRVSTFNGTSSVSVADHFTYAAAPLPAVTKIAPTSGPPTGGTKVTIIGSHFTGATGVSFGSTAAISFSVISDTAIVATAPAQAAGTVDITVTTYSGTSATSSADRFSYVAASAPAVTSISPTSGSTAGGAVVTISGSNFTGATGVVFGTVPSGSFSISSDSQIIALAPPQAADTVDVTVTTPNGTSAISASDRFTYSTATAPAVTGITPTSGSSAGGTQVTITGSGFTGATGVTFGGTPASSFTIQSGSTIVATAPSQAAGTVDITVTTPSGASLANASDRFTYSAAAAPAVTAVTPTTGGTGGGTLVSITGSGFTGASAVSFGATSASAFTVLSDTLLSATAPPQASSTVDVTVTTPSGTSATSAADRFTYSAAPLPAVTAITPTSGSAAGGTVVKITGSNFTGTSGVSFGSSAATDFTLLSDTALTAIAPAQGAGTVDITVTTLSGTSATSAADRFTYAAVPVPTVTAVSPSSGSTGGGTVVTVTGTNFSSATSVSFDTALASNFTVVSDTSITITAPPYQAGTWDVTVTNATGTSSSVPADRFTYTAAPAPAVTAIGPTSGSTAGGTVATITGTNFSGASAVSFGTVPASNFTVVSDTSVIATAPPQAAGTVDVTLTTPTGTSAVGTADRFSYTAAAAPTVTAINPTSGTTAGGTPVVLTGNGFTGASGVSFGTVSATNFAVLSDTSLIALAPPQAAATVDITVTTPSGTSATSAADRFSYTAAPAPAVTGITPSSGTMAGGTVVTITGSNFTGASAVCFGGTPATTFSVVSDTAITATSPYHAAGTVDVTVTTPSGTSATSAADQFSYVYVTAPAPAAGQSHLLAVNPQELLRCPLPSDK
jgi:hypothetical protein